MRGKRTTRYAFVSLLNARDMIAAHKRIRRLRPWMWGPLKRQWLIYSEALEFPYAVVGKYRWKNKADRDLEKRLDRCCCHPDRERHHA